MDKEIRKKIKVLEFKKKGFTLLEIFIAISVIIILSSVVIINYRSNQKELALQRTAYKFSQDIRRAAEMAMAAKEKEGESPNGYGLHLKESDKNFYIIYADKNGNEKYDGSDKKIETINLEKGIIIKISLPSNFSVNFEPPSPIVKLKDGGGNDQDLITVIFSLESDPNKAKRVTINGLGMVEIE